MAHFIEDDQIMTMGISEEAQRTEFPLEEELDEQSNQDSDEEETEVEFNVSINNNATRNMALGALSTAGSPSLNRAATIAKEAALPDRLNYEPRVGQKITEVAPNMSANLEQTFCMVQSFMLKKGLIDKSLTEDEMQSFLKESEPRQLNMESMPVEKQTKSKADTGERSSTNCDNNSEVTIYQRAIPDKGDCKDSNACGLEEQIERFINHVRLNMSNSERKLSSSSEEMNTSDESDNIALLNASLIAGRCNQNIAEPQPGTSGMCKDNGNRGPETTPEAQADNLIRDAERSRARLLEVPGKSPPILSTVQIDEDYQMIDSHLDDMIKRKIVNFKYIDFSKLINRSKVISEQDQRLEIVNHNGMTYFAPVADNIQINTYGKWEQAFRIYSNTLTSVYPSEAPELLQYNHTIHTASSSYVWDNVYAYDKEFRHHIGRHPSRSWAIIL